MPRPSDVSRGGESESGRSGERSAGRIRRPAVAGMFYPAESSACIRAAEALLRQGAADAAADAGAFEHLLGGIVPHAGWICSGPLAGEVIAELARRGSPEIVVVFGAVHTPLHCPKAALASYERWQEPGGAAEAAGELGRRLASERGSIFTIDDRFHVDEHAVEVELPLVQAAWPEARILPIEVPLTEEAIEVGRQTAEAIKATGARAIYLASSDLTHYGPAYRFSPAGVGTQGLAWAKDNDRRLLDVVTDLQVERVVPTVRDDASACGGGAIAAMLAACRECGAGGARVLRHANSFETLAAAGHPVNPDNAVGYAAVVVGA